MCRLRVLEMYIHPYSAALSDVDTLSFLIRSLRISLTFPAILEHIKLDILFNNYFDHSGFYNDLRNADVWSLLDSIITHPTGSQLQRVDIKIKYQFWNDGNVTDPHHTEVSKPILDALPLLREKGILFVKAAER